MCSPLKAQARQQIGATLRDESERLVNDALQHEYSFICSLGASPGRAQQEGRQMRLIADISRLARGRLDWT